MRAWSSKVKQLEKRLKKIQHNQPRKIFIVKNQQRVEQIKSQLPEHTKALFIIDPWRDEKEV